MAKPNRETTTETLILSLQRRYPEKGFLIHPAVSFCFSHGTDADADAGGMGVMARERIQKDDVLLVIPEAVRFSTPNVLLCTSRNDKHNHQAMRAMNKKLLQTCSQWQNYFDPQEISLTVSVMHVLRRKSSPHIYSDEDPFVLQAATWPSEEDMKESSMFYWDASKVKEILNQSLLTSNFERRQKVLREIFDGAVLPLLKRDADNFIDSNLSTLAAGSNNDDDDMNGKSEETALWRTFLYAFSLVWSRTHGSPDPELIPLIELFNGNSDRVRNHPNRGSKKDTIINVDLTRGMWPFMRGPMFRDDCNLACSAVYANRDIDKGEELIISYGDLSAGNFMLKYGAVPENLISHHDAKIQMEVSLWCDPSLIPSLDPQDLRVQCLRNRGCPLEEFKSNKWCICDLNADESALELLRCNGQETDAIKHMRQFLILAVLADDEELHRNIATDLIRGRLYAQRVVPLMCQMVDYNLEMLAPGTNATSTEDAKQARHPDTPPWKKAALWARIEYRESLMQWRHAFAKQGTNIHVEDRLEGCAICGRTYPCLKCSRCKEVRYCSRGHQKLDWKNHKIQCVK